MIEAPKVDRRKRLGPHSRAIDRGAVGEIDGRSRAGRFLRCYQAMLEQHLGGSPSIVQRQMTARAARLALHLELMDDEALKAGGMSDRNSRQYLAWSNALSRLLFRIGIKPVAERAPSLAEYLAGRAADKAASEQVEPAA